MNNREEYGQHSAPHNSAGRGELRTRIVIVLTLSMMLVEVAAGLWFGSMALLADGIHMASHAVALGITAYAYWYSRRHAFDPRFAFGTGKVNALGGFTGAVLLAVFALMMALGSFERLIVPVDIAFNQAIAVAILGLFVNGASVLILGERGHDSHSHGHSVGHDHNLRAAYLHVLADAVTSLAAIFALLTAKYFGWLWMDPLMGIAGALLVGRWSFGLMRSSAEVLLDRQAGEQVWTEAYDALSATPGVQVEELRVWYIGPGVCAVAAHVSDGNLVGPSRIAAGLDPDEFPYVVVHPLSGE